LGITVSCFLCLLQDHCSSAVVVAACGFAVLLAVYDVGVDAVVPSFPPPLYGTA
jgi:hypothetical protein